MNAKCVSTLPRRSSAGCVNQDVHVEPPDEDARKKPGLIARLHKAMYGLREVPLIWQRVLRDTMRNVGFRAFTAA